MSSLFAGRRAFLAAAAAAGAAPLLAGLPAQARGRIPPPLATLQLDTDLLHVAYHAAGPESGRPVVLDHDFNYGIDSFAAVAPRLAASGHRVLAPFLRGHGGTRFRDQDTPRSAQQAALGKDLIDFIDALHFPEAVFVGIGWGAHAAYAASVVRPSRVAGLVLAGAGRAGQAGPWHQFYFGTAAGNAELEVHRADIARVLWKKHSPATPFDALRFERAAHGFDNPDHVAILAHAYRHRQGQAEGDPRYAALEQRFASPPPAAMPAIVLQGGASAVPPATGLRFSSFHAWRELPGRGHDLGLEAPDAVAAAAAELIAMARWRT